MCKNNSILPVWPNAVKKQKKRFFVCVLVNSFLFFPAFVYKILLVLSGDLGYIIRAARTCATRKGSRGYTWICTSRRRSIACSAEAAAKAGALALATERGKKMSEQVEIELFDNPRPERDYCINIRCPEFTSLCPRTGQPDFGEIVIDYCPDKLCIELKSLKLYMQSYRNKGIFYEALTNDILDDLKGVCEPRWMKVTSRFTPRGGITTEVVAEYKEEK